MNETACEFFAPDLILEAKKLLSTEAAVSTRATDRQKMTDDMIRCLDLCDEPKLVLPHFFIFEPDEGPVVLGETTATRTQQFNELYLKFNNLVDSEMLRANLGFSHNRSSHASNPTYIVVLNSPPKLTSDDLIQVVSN